MSQGTGALEDRQANPRQDAVCRDDASRTFFPLLREGTKLLLSGVEFVFGLVALVVGLAVLAAIPVLQFLSLGYLLEAGGRVARSGRLRDGWIGVRTAARLGGVV